MAELIKLHEVAAPNLIDFNTNDIIDEIIDRIQRHPDWKQIWNGELKQDALYVIINIFAYLFSKNAEVANRLIKENFILLAKDPDNIVNLMSNYGLRIRSNTHSIANIKVTRQDGGNLTSDLIISGIPGRPFEIYSNKIKFEIYEKDENGKIDYFKSITLRKGLVNNLLAYSGSTGFETIAMDSQEKKEKFYYQLSNYPVIEDSIRVYYFFNNEKIELQETESFAIASFGDTDRFPGGQPFYKLIYNSYGRAGIVFGTKEFGGSFPKEEFGELQVFYRYGGGSETNIADGAMVYNANVGDVPLLFTNNGKSGGGVNVEDLDLAKFYAPMRVGRGKQIVDDRDALLALAGMAVKHKIISPKYSILPNKDSVPILHYYNYIVPFRNFNEFNLPTPDSFDNASTYEYKMRAALNDFLNLSKLHDGFISDEVISGEYTEDNLKYALNYKPVLSGTLTVSAYDHYNIEIDKLIYSSSYYGETNINDSNTSTAKLKSHSRITDNVFNLNDRNQFDFEMDGYLMKITIPNQINGVSIQYNSPTILAEKVNELIINTIKESWKTNDPLQLIPIGQNHITLNYNYFYYNNGYFYLNSPKIGINSSLKILLDKNDTPRNKFLSLIKFTGGNVVSYYSNAVPESRKIFLDNSNFNYVNNSIEIKLNLDDINREKTLNKIIVWPDRNSRTGPKLSYALRDENLRNIFLKQNSNINLEIYDVFGILKDRVVFENVNPGEITPGFRIETDKNGNTISGQSEIFKDAVFEQNVYTGTCFDYNDSTLYFALADSDDEQTSAPYSFPREPFVNGFLENSISDVWAQYDDGIEAVLPVDGFGKKFNFVSNNFIAFPSPDPKTVGDNIPTGWEYYYDTYEEKSTIIEKKESEDPEDWYYDFISYEEKILVPRVDENGDPVFDDNGVQIIDEVWLPFSTNIYFKTQYDLIIVDTQKYRNIVIGNLIKPLVDVEREIIEILPSPDLIDGDGNENSVIGKLVLTKKDKETKYQLEKGIEITKGMGVSYPFSIADENTNSQLRLSFSYTIFSDANYISEYVNGDLKIFIVAENENKTIVLDDIAIINELNEYEVTWNSIDFKNYRLSFHSTNEKINKYRIFFENLQVYQEPIDTTYYLDILEDNIDSLSLYKIETDLVTQISRGQGLSYDISLNSNQTANLNFSYEITDGTYKDSIAVSVIGINMVNNAYTYHLLNLNDNYNKLYTGFKQYFLKLNNTNNNKVSVNFQTSEYNRFRVIFHMRNNQAESFRLNINDIQVGTKPLDIYNESFYFKFDFGREKFNSIRCSYEPHPYFQEDEAMGFLDVLRNQKRRVIGVEPLLKKINYNPLGINLLLTFSSVSNIEMVLNNYEKIIIDNFSYNNDNENIKIGEIFSLDLLNQKLIQSFVNYGLINAKVTDISSLINESPLGDDYYFISPPDLYQNLLLLEDQYPHIKGVAEKYAIKVSYIKF